MKLGILTKGDVASDNKNGSNRFNLAAKKVEGFFMSTDI